MHQLVCKLKDLKPDLRRLNKDKFSHIYQQCNLLREQLFQIQEAIKGNAGSELITKELETIKELNWRLKAARLMKLQQVKQEWVQEGDTDSRLFHAWVKKRRLKNHISFIHNSSGQVVEKKSEIAQVVVDYFQKMIGVTEWTKDIQNNIIGEGRVLSVEQQIQLIAPISAEDVKKHLFDIPPCKSPGPDGFNSGFFKHQWHLVGDLVTKAVLEFFKDGVTLQQINHTNIWLIPKAEPQSIECILDSLKEFKETTGLMLNYDKIFLLPDNVMKKIMALCRNFLWSSTPDYKKCPLVSWDEVCLPKQEGGLGLKNLLKWNQACLMKLLWDIANKKDTIWVKWIHNKYLKGSSVWDYTTKPDDCYYWKKLVQTRCLFMGMNMTSCYTVKEGYNWLVGSNPKVEWFDMVWNKWSIPKHCFITWLIWRGRLLTKDRLSRFINLDTTCGLCNNGVESVDHLFCSCALARLILENISQWIHVDIAAGSIRELGSRVGKGKNRKSRRTIATCIAASCYFIWKARNGKLHNNREAAKEHIVQGIKAAVTMAIGHKVNINSVAL
ncbi:unnamed protein product [Cuscuta campestris]|uniref:Reverse transcriptase zinc-binding domain-containing protein n=1 Tax=Cuscuta campestris TaxID=132261 RepID=A0A484K8Z6_9ASTE|nr:unnamed protein product [Cuscuta campestris]